MRATRSRRLPHGIKQDHQFNFKGDAYLRERLDEAALHAECNVSAVLRNGAEREIDAILGPEEAPFAAYLVAIAERDILRSAAVPCPQCEYHRVALCNTIGPNRDDHA